MTLIRTLVSTVALAAAALFIPTAEANGWHGGGGGWHGGGWHGGGWHGGGWHGGYWRGGYCCYGGYWPYWGGVALGLGIGAVGYYSTYPGYYYGPTWGTYYDAPVMAGPTYSTAEPAQHSGQPVPQASNVPEPIFYPRNGQSAEATENDRRDCNRWATTQRGAMSDASIFQRATFACMEGRGYTVK